MGPLRNPSLIVWDSGPREAGAHCPTDSRPAAPAPTYRGLKAPSWPKAPPPHPQAKVRCRALKLLPPVVDIHHPQSMWKGPCGPPAPPLLPAGTHSLSALRTGALPGSCSGAQGSTLSMPTSVHTKRTVPVPSALPSAVQGNRVKGWA